MFDAISHASHMSIREISLARNKCKDRDHESQKFAMRHGLEILANTKSSVIQTVN